MSVYKGNKVTSVYKGDKLIASNMAAGTDTVAPQYIRDQNILDMTNEVRKFKLDDAYSKDRAVQMPYDGILNMWVKLNYWAVAFVLDKNKQLKYSMNYDAQDGGLSNISNIVFCKGDYLYFESGKDITRSSALYFYKKRDYTGR